MTTRLLAIPALAALALVSLSVAPRSSPPIGASDVTGLLPAWPPATESLESVSFVNLSLTNLSPWPQSGSEVVILSVPLDSWFVLTSYPRIGLFEPLVLVERLASGAERVKWGARGELDGAPGFTSRSTPIGIPFKPGSQIILRNLSTKTFPTASYSIAGYYDDHARGIFTFESQPSPTSASLLVLPAGGSTTVAQVPDSAKLIMVWSSILGAELRATVGGSDVALGRLQADTYVASPAAGLTGIVVEPGATVYLRNSSTDPAPVTAKLVGYFAPL